MVLLLQLGLSYVPTHWSGRRGLQQQWSVELWLVDPVLGILLGTVGPGWCGPLLRIDRVLVPGPLLVAYREAVFQLRP